MNLKHMDYLLRSNLYVKVKPEHLADLLSAQRPMVIVTKSLKVKYVGETNMFTGEEWARMVANGRVFVEYGRERHYMAEHLNDEALPVLPMPIEQVYADAAPAVATQGTLELNNKPAQAAN